MARLAAVEAKAVVPVILLLFLGERATRLTRLGAKVWELGFVSVLISVFHLTWLQGQFGFEDSFFFMGLLQEQLVEVDGLVDESMERGSVSSGDDRVFDLGFEATIKHDTFGGVIEFEGGGQGPESLGIGGGGSGLREALEFVFGISLVGAIIVNVRQGGVEGRVIAT